jgi:hypothetical protein
LARPQPASPAPTTRARRPAGGRMFLLLLGLAALVFYLTTR